MSVDVALQIGGYFVTGFGAYMAIRVDLARLQVNMANMQSVINRHERLLEK